MKPIAPKISSQPFIPIVLVLSIKCLDCISLNGNFVIFSCPDDICHTFAVISCLFCSHNQGLYDRTAAQDINQYAYALKQSNFG